MREAMWAWLKWKIESADKSWSLRNGNVPTNCRVVLRDDDGKLLHEAHLYHESRMVLGAGGRMHHTLSTSGGMSFEVSTHPGKYLSPEALQAFLESLRGIKERALRDREAKIVLAKKRQAAHADLELCFGSGTLPPLDDGAWRFKDETMPPSKSYTFTMTLDPLTVHAYGVPVRARDAAHAYELYQLWGKQIDAWTRACEEKSDA